MDSPPIPLPPRGALERVFASAAASDSLDSFTLKLVRTALAASPIRWECSDKQWKQIRDQIKQEWTALLEAYHAEQEPYPHPPPASNRATSSEPKSEHSEAEEDEEDSMKPRTKYDRAAEKNVKVLLGAFGDFLGGLATGPEESEFEDRSEDDDKDDADATPTPEKLPAKKKKKRKSVVILSSDESDPCPRPSKKKKPRKSQKSASTAAAPPAEGNQASTSLSRSLSVSRKPNSKATKRKSSSERRRTAAEETLTITDSEDSDADSDSIPKAQQQQQQPVASTSISKATRPPAAATTTATTTMSMRDSDLSEVEDTGFLPGAKRRRFRSERTKGVKKGKGRAKTVGTDEEEEEVVGGTTTSQRKGKGTASKENKKKKRAERKAPAPKLGDAPKGTDAEEARIKKLKELVTAAGTARPFTASTGAERTLTVSRRTEILEGLLEKLGLATKGDRMPSLNKAKQVGEKRALDKEMQELGGTAHHTGLRTGKELHAVDSSSSDDDQGGDEKQAGLSGSAKKKQLLAERKQFGAFLGAQSDDDGESD